MLVHGVMNSLCKWLEYNNVRQYENQKPNNYIWILSKLLTSTVIAPCFVTVWYIPENSTSLSRSKTGH